MLQLKNINEEAHDWLVRIPKSSWCKHVFKYWSKCDVLINNLAESLNSTLLVAREKPIITLVEWIRSYLMNRLSTFRERLDNYHGDIMPKPRKHFNIEVEKSGNWLAKNSNDNIVEVQHTYMPNCYIVDIEK